MHGLLMALMEQVPIQASTTCWWLQEETSMIQQEMVAMVISNINERVSSN
jgi:hypothetical protein